MFPFSFWKTSDWPSTVLYDGTSAALFELGVGNASTDVYMGCLNFTTATRIPISRLSFKLAKKAGDISGKLFYGRIWSLHNNNTNLIDAILAATPGVACSNSGSAVLVTVNFPVPFWTDVGTKYALTIDMGLGVFDGTNYATGYFNSKAATPSAPPGSAANWQSGHTNQTDFGSSFTAEMKVWVASSPPAPQWTEYKGAIGGQAYRILVPPTPNGHGVMIHHSANQNEYFTFWETAFPTANALVSSGYTICESVAHGDNWGNQASVDDYVALAALVRSTYSVGNMVLWGTSMGGLSSLILLKQGNVPNIVGWFGVSAVCNLANMYDGGLGFFAADINTAYNIPGGGNYATQTAGHDPVLFSGSAFDGLAMRFYASPSDAVVVKANNSDVMAALVAGHASQNTVVTTSGAHGAVGNFPVADIIAWVQTLI